MANLKFEREITALLVIDPYNDFVSEGGKIWQRVKAVGEAAVAAGDLGKYERGSTRRSRRLIGAMCPRRKCIT